MRSEKDVLTQRICIGLAFRTGTFDCLQLREKDEEKKDMGKSQKG